MVIVFGLVLPITTAWVLITQPIWASVEADHKQIDVDTVRLKTHVKKLSETLPPRDYSHPAPFALRNIAGEENGYCMKVRTGQTSRPVIGVVGSGVTEFSARAAIP